MAHIDLAADFQYGGEIAGQSVRDFFDHPCIGCHVLANPSIAPCCRLNEFPFFIAQGNGEAIDFGFANEGDLIVFGKIQKPPDASKKLTDIVFIEGVPER